jgi:dienelactone hydrolase
VKRWWTSLVLTGVLMGAAVGASAQSQVAPAPSTERWTVAKEPPLAADLHEELQWITVTVKDLTGRAETKQIPVTVYRPSGDGPFPLAVFNHGRQTRDFRPAQGRSRPETMARWLVRKGFVVMAPTRVGYADTFGRFDPEFAGECKDRRLEPLHEAMAEQTLATVAHARQLPYVDASRWVVMGGSAGGLGSLATAARAPEGLAGVINLSGGIGGDPVRMPRRPCRPDQLAAYWEQLAGRAEAPTLWLYWENDQFWGAEHPHEWFRAWNRGSGRGEFHMYPPSGKEGHFGINENRDRWIPQAEAFLNELGFRRPGLPPRPPASGYAAVNDLNRVPMLSPAVRNDHYRRFVQARPPKAFALSERGAMGWATGDWAAAKALTTCERYGAPCRFYALDNDVVWTNR